MYYSRISGMGYYLPKKTLSNKELEKMVNTSDEWIKQRTGISSRHIADSNELPSDMALEASLKALEESKLTAKDLDLILLATLLPDKPMPNTACILQNKLGISKTPALDISAACSGFMYGMSIANQFIQTGKYKNILVVGAEALHLITNYTDRRTCILFGDGAGAFILSRNTDPETGRIYHDDIKAYGEMGSSLFIKGFGADYLSKIKDGEMRKADAYIHMDGQMVFKTAIQIMRQSYEKILNETDFTPEQMDWLVPHQANERILKSFCKQTGFPEKKVIFDIKELGNTSSASIPLSFARAVEKGRIQRGQNIFMIGMGGGMTSGSVFLKY